MAPESSNRAWRHPSSNPASSSRLGSGQVAGALRPDHEVGEVPGTAVAVLRLPQDRVREGADAPREGRPRLPQADLLAEVEVVDGPGGPGEPAQVPADHVVAEGLGIGAAARPPEGDVDQADHSGVRCSGAARWRGPPRPAPRRRRRAAAGPGYQPRASASMSSSSLKRQTSAPSREADFGLEPLHDLGELPGEALGHLDGQTGAAHHDRPGRGAGVEGAGGEDGGAAARLLGGQRPGPAARRRRSGEEEGDAAHGRAPAKAVLHGTGPGAHRSLGAGPR